MHRLPFVLMDFDSVVCLVLESARRSGVTGRSSLLTVCAMSQRLQLSQHSQIGAGREVSLEQQEFKYGKTLMLTIDRVIKVFIGDIAVALGCCNPLLQFRLYLLCPLISLTISTSLAPAILPILQTQIICIIVLILCLLSLLLLPTEN
jgi:hypothetical protein